MEKHEVIDHHQDDQDDTDTTTPISTNYTSTSTSSKYVHSDIIVPTSTCKYHGLWENDLHYFKIGSKNELKVKL